MRHYRDIALLVFTLFYSNTLHKEISILKVEYGILQKNVLNDLRKKETNYKSTRTRVAEELLDEPLFLVQLSFRGSTTSRFKRIESLLQTKILSNLCNLILCGYIPDINEQYLILSYDNLLCFLLCLYFCYILIENQHRSLRP